MVCTLIEEHMNPDKGSHSVVHFGALAVNKLLHLWGVFLEADADHFEALVLVLSVNLGQMRKDGAAWSTPLQIETFPV
jgi:hypothetical protein